VVLFSLGLGAFAASVSFLPLRFGVAALLGAGGVAAACLATDKRRFFLGLLSFSVILQSSKRLWVVPGSFLGQTDALALTLTDAALFAGYAAWFFYARPASSSAETRGGLAVFMLVLIFAVLPSFVKTGDLRWSFLEWTRMWKALLLYWFVSRNARSLDDVRRMTMFLAAGLFLQAGVAALQRYGGGGPAGLLYFGGSETAVQSFVGASQILRAGGTWGHPNYFAYYLDLLVPLMLSLSLSPWVPAARRRVYLAAFGAGVFCLYLSQSRAGWLAAGGSSALCFLFVAARNLRQGRLRAPILVMAALAVGAGIAVHESVYRRFAMKDQGAAMARVHQWRVAKRVAMENPVLGVGLNNYTAAAPRYDDTPVRISTSFPAPVHNVYLLALGETGLLGLAALLALMAAAFRASWFPRWPEGEQRDALRGLFFGLLAYFLHANVDMNPVGSYGFLFFILGLVTAAGKAGARGAEAS
jgi:O-antigen ligase